MFEFHKIEEIMGNSDGQSPYSAQVLDFHNMYDRGRGSRVGASCRRPPDSDAGDPPRGRGRRPTSPTRRIPSRATPDRCELPPSAFRDSLVLLILIESGFRSGRISPRFSNLRLRTEG